MTKQKNSKSNNFLVQGSILAIAGIVVRLIGLLYRVPLTNIIGEEGIGVYSTAYSIYNILLLISSYTLPLAVSRLIAARLAIKDYTNSNRLFIGACVFALISGGLMGGICLFGADFFADIMNMPQASFAIKTLSPTIFIMAFLGVLRGYFQGHKTMVPTAVSQIIEQIVNAAISLLAGYLLFKSGSALDAANGTGSYYAASYGAGGGTIGTGAGALSAFIFCLLLYFAHRPKALKAAARDSHKEESYKFLMKVLVLTIIPVLISTTIYQVSTVIDQAIYAKYVNTDYTGIWGAYNGKFMLLVHVPTAIASSLGSAVIPTLAAALQSGSKKEITDKSSIAIRFNMVIAIPATIGLAFLAKPIMDLLFSSDNTLAATMMMVGSTTIMFTAMSTITNSILQGIGNIWLPVRNAVISLVLHIGILALLLWGFDMGIYGVIYANIAFYIIMSVLNNLTLKKRLGYKQEWIKTFASPIIASAVMGIAALLIYKGLYAISGSNFISVFAAIIVAVIVYFAALLLSKGVGEEDLLRMPMGAKILSISKKLHLIRS